MGPMYGIISYGIFYDSSDSFLLFMADIIECLNSAVHMTYLSIYQILCDQQILL